MWDRTGSSHVEAGKPNKVEKVTQGEVRRGAGRIRRTCRNYTDIHDILPLETLSIALGCISDTCIDIDQQIFSNIVWGKKTFIMLHIISHVKKRT